jgi:branched-chain amino acid transport system substrate-binding protein
MQDVAAENQKIFICCGSSTPDLCGQVAKDYDTYKYFFRGTPFNSTFLVGTDFLMLEMVGNMLKEELGIEGNLRVAIIAEKLVWADPMVLIAQARLPTMGMDVVGTWRPSDTATDVTAELTAIAAEDPHIIFTTFSGPVGVTYAKQWGELEIPACSVGINVEAQKLGFWEATGGKANYEMTLNTYARGVKLTEKTISFVEAFVEKTGEIPTYTAGTYDTILNLVNIVEEQQTLDADTLIPYIEATDFVGTSGRVTYFPNDARPPAYPHDLVWGAGYLTGIATQWQDGELKCVWPWDWEGITYEGTVQYQIPPRVIEKFGQ